MTITTLQAFGAAAAGWAITCLLMRRLDRLGAPAENFRGRTVRAGAGTVLLGPLFGGLAVALAGTWAGDFAIRPAAVMASAGVLMCALGAADDRFGSPDKGLRGHLSALRRGRITTGLVKLTGGIVVGIGAGLLLQSGGPIGIVRDGAVVALSANFVNLLDLRPGRACKAWMGLTGVVLAVGAATAGPDGGALVVVAAVAGGVVAWLPADLLERAMLGDAGANLLGAVAGILAVTALAPTGRWVVAGVLAALTLLSERVSFSKVIAATPPLRILDELGTDRAAAR